MFHKFQKVNMSYAYKTSYTADSMARAVAAVRRKTKSVRKAAAEFGVPRSTLMDHLKGPSPTHIIMGRPRDLTDEEETALVGLLTYMSQQGVPATRDVLSAKVRELVNSSG